jgi:hypothetical protein
MLRCNFLFPLSTVFVGDFVELTILAVSERIAGRELTRSARSG